MDIQNKLIIELKERLGYAENITLTRDEFNLLVDGDLGYAKELEGEVSELADELEDFKSECECAELQEKLDKIIEIAEG